MVILNKREDAIELLDRRGAKYMDRPILHFFDEYVYTSSLLLFGKQLTIIKNGLGRYDNLEIQRATFQASQKSFPKRTFDRQVHTVSTHGARRSTKTCEEAH